MSDGRQPATGITLPARTLSCQDAAHLCDSGSLQLGTTAGTNTRRRCPLALRLLCWVAHASFACMNKHAPETRLRLQASGPQLAYLQMTTARSRTSATWRSLYDIVTVHACMPASTGVLIFNLFLWIFILLSLNWRIATGKQHFGSTAMGIIHDCTSSQRGYYEVRYALL